LFRRLDATQFKQNRLFSIQIVFRPNVWYSVDGNGVAGSDKVLYRTPVNPNNDSRFVFPIDPGAWQDADNGEMPAEDASEIGIRGFAWQLPSLDEFARVGVNLEQPPQVRTFEVCRFLSEVAREQLLATYQDRRISVLPDMTQLLQLEEWHHPNLAGGDRARSSETFRQLAQVLATCDVGLYCPSQPANTDWQNWPEGGRR
jgi:hypothetical protein